MSFDQEAYEEFSELIVESYESLLDFQAYSEEAVEAEDPVYRREAVLRAFSSANRLHSEESNWDYLFDVFPADVDSVEDIIISTELYDNRLQIYGLELDGEPDEEEMAAINAVKDNYEILQDYDMLGFWREFDVDIGGVQLRMEV